MSRLAALVEACDALTADEIVLLWKQLRVLHRQKTRQRALAGPTLRLGDRVCTRDDTRPQALAGQYATVSGYTGKGRVIVDFDRPHGRFYRNVRCQPSMLVKVGA